MDLVYGQTIKLNLVKHLHGEG